MITKNSKPNRPAREIRQVLLRVCVMMLGMGLGVDRAANAQQVQWIWTAAHRAEAVPQTSCFFRKSFRMIDPEQGQLQIAVNDRGTAFLNGNYLGEILSSEQTTRFDLTSLLIPGINVLAVQVDNTAGPTAGLAAAIVVKEKSEDKWRMLPTGENWNSSCMEHQDWSTPDCKDVSWDKCQVVQAKDVTTSTPATSVSTSSASPSENHLAKPSPAVRLPTEVATDTTAPDLPTTGVSLRLEHESPTAEAPQSLEAPPKQLQPTPDDSSRYSISSEFVVDTIADPSVGSLIAMEFDEWGRMICSRESGGLIRIDLSVASGEPGHVRLICDQIQGCQGILALNGNLFVTGLGPAGLALYRLSDRDNDGTMEQLTALLKFTGTVGEHGPHGVALGPDGYLYVMIGNANAIDGEVNPTSPYAGTYEANIVPKIEDPGGHAVGVKAPGGTIARCRLDGSDAAIYAGGIRNAYDMAFDHNGELLTHDSDMETDIGTGWYRPTAVYQVQSGAELGWRSGWSTFGSHQPDCVGPIAETGRGSPTGVVVYNHRAFPQRFHNSLFLGDWSEGRILNVSLREGGGTYTAKTEVFLQSRPLNVTDLAVGPDGGLYFCTGGRGTGGGVFRIKWRGEATSQIMVPESPTLLLLTFPQPQSAWARQALAKIQTQMGAEWKPTLEAAATDSNLDATLRVRALELLSLYGPPPNISLLRAAASDANAQVRVRAAKLMGTRSREIVEPDLMVLLRDAEPWVRRVACESLVRIGAQPSLQELIPCLQSSDRSESFAARRLLETIDANVWRDEALCSDDIRIVIQSSLALMIAHPSTENGYMILARTSALLDGFISDADFHDLLRVVQLALTEGRIDPEKIPAFVARITEEFPCKNARINGELAKILSYLNARDAAQQITTYFAESTDSSQEKLYVALMLQSMAGTLDPSARRAILWTIERALAVQGAGGGYYAYLSGIAENLARLITADELDAVLERGNEWPHAIIAAFYLLPEKLTSQLAARLIQIDQAPTLRTDSATRKMHAGILALLAGSGDDAARAYLHAVWQNDELRRNDVALVLAQKPEGDNWPYLVSSFPNLDADTAPEVLMKLQEVNRRPRDGKHYRELIQLALRLKDSGAIAASALLEHWTQQRLSGKSDWQSAVQHWMQWFAQAFPNEAPIAAANEPRIQTSWTATELINAVAALENSPDAGQGQRLFSTVQCGKCHRFGLNGEGLGPDLTGLAGRFTRADMIDAMVHPSKTVSDQYRGKKITTRDGKTVSGLLTIGSERSWVVLDSKGERITIPTEDVEEIVELNQSTMPDGLLDNLTAREVGDLIAFLQSEANGRVADLKTTTQGDSR